MARPAQIERAGSDGDAVSLASSRVRLVDALRGVAASVVALHHAHTLFPGVDSALAGVSPMLATAVLALTRRNVEAVLLFFVISGFSIATSVRGRPFCVPGALGHYAGRRARRILPLYGASLVLAALVAFTVAPVPEHARALSTLLGNLLLLQTAPGVPGQWVEPWAANTPLWSLSFEVFYYAAFPLLWRTVASPAARLCVVALVSAAGYACGAFAPNPLAMFCASGLVWYLGVELAALRHDGRASLPLAVFVALWLLALALRTAVDRVVFHGLWVGASWFLGGALALYAARTLHAVPGRKNACGVVCARLTEPLVRLGGVSYALYLLHVPVLRAARAVVGPGWAAAATGLAMALLLAFVAERLAGPRANAQADRPRGAPRAKIVHSFRSET